MSPLRWTGPLDEPDDDQMAEARAEMEHLLEEAGRDPFVALDRDIEDNPAYEEYEEEVEDARLNAYAMMDDLDRWEAEDADDEAAEEADDDGGGDFDGGLWDG